MAAFRKGLVLAVVLAAAGCANRYHYSEPTYTARLGERTVLEHFDITPELEDRILALDPDHISAEDIRNVLAKAPAPRIINIHGGIYPVHLAMKSFSRFCRSMGYPEGKLRNPRNGAYSYSCYKSSTEIAGILAWYYEREGMRPMIVGHSQGGMQAVKVLHELDGEFSRSLEVRNPLAERWEGRTYIIDPLSGQRRSVVGVEASYATAVGAGGLTRFLPNQWALVGKLHTIPDTVVEFTGFYTPADLIGGDMAGLRAANEYHANGIARVRTVELPFSHDHVTVPITYKLARDRMSRAWINAYIQFDKPEMPEFRGERDNILWAADVWTSIKRHWVLELQRLIRAKREYLDVS